jgi:hypothetical protein
LTRTEYVLATIASRRPIVWIRRSYERRNEWRVLRLLLAVSAVVGNHGFCTTIAKCAGETGCPVPEPAHSGASKCSECRIAPH